MVDAASAQGRKSVRDATIMITVGLFVTTLALTQMLARIPLQNLLKNDLRVGIADNAAFFFWTTAPWYLKPLFGLLLDTTPLWGSKRKSYILLGSMLTAASWLALGLAPHRYGLLFWVCLAVNMATVLAYTGIAAAMVEVAHATDGAGRFSSLRSVITQICYMLNGPASGLLAGIAFGWTCAACGGIFFLLIPVTLLFLHEDKTALPRGDSWHEAGIQLRRMANARLLWAVAVLMGLFYVAPGLWTAAFYIQQNQLKMNTNMQGGLVFADGLGGMLAAGLYALFCRRMAMRQLLLLCLGVAGLTSLGYLVYDTVTRAFLVEFFYTFGYTLGELVLFDLALRVTPVGSEGLGFAILLSVRAIGIYGTDWLGSSLMENMHVPFSWLVTMNAATTWLTLPLILLLPGRALQRAT